MEKIKSLLKPVLKRILKIVLWLLFSVLFFAFMFALLSILFFFLLYIVGAYPMDFTDSEALSVFLLVIFQLVYFVVFVIEGAIIGFFIGTYLQLKKTIMGLKFIRHVFDKVMKGLYKLMKKKGYIGIDDFDKHKGKERVSYSQTLSALNSVIEEVVSQESGGPLGLFTSPLRWVTLRFGNLVLKRGGKFMLQRMRKKEKSGDFVIFLDVLETAAKEGIWTFVKKYLITPLFMFTLASLGIFLLVILLPIGICNLLSWFL